jgi:hypothetical protein
MAAAETSEMPKTSLDTLDLSGYRCVYISFGSKNQLGKLPFYQTFPFFLEFINKYPLCVISIDNYDTFEKEEEDVPFDTWNVKPRKRYTRITIPTHTMDQTIHITQQLVELLNTHKPEQVFFVNFIKYLDKSAHDAGPEKEAAVLQSHLGEYKDNYYEWCGFTLFRDFILKIPSTPNPMFNTVKQILAARNTLNNPFLKLLKNDDDELRKKFSSYHAIRDFLIDITPQITPDQYNLLDTDLKEFEGGKRTRKRRRKRRTRR